MFLCQLIKSFLVITWYVPKQFTLFFVNKLINNVHRSVFAVKQGKRFKKCCCPHFWLSLLLILVYCYEKQKRLASQQLINFTKYFSIRIG